MFHLGRLEERTDLLVTRITDLERTAKRKRLPSFPWREIMPWAWGIIMFIMALVSPQTVDRVGKLMALVR